jgi:hypothetical protein
MNVTASRVASPCWIELPQTIDARGTLTSIESGLEIPFETKRVFFITDPSGDRGNHAHRYTSQLIVSAAGSFSVDVSTGPGWTTYQMTERNRALYLPPMTWARLHAFSDDAVCLVLADTSYGESSYIRDWNEFVREAASKNA